MQLGEMDGDEDTMSDDEGEEEQPQKSAPSALPSIVEPLLALIHPAPLSFPPTAGAASPHPPTTSALSAIHICALECLNNVFLSLATPARLQSQGFASDADREAGPRIWERVWRALEVVGTDVDGPGQERRRDMWQIAVGVLWGVSLLWKGILVSRFAADVLGAHGSDEERPRQIPQEAQVGVLIQLCTAAPDASVKVKCIGTLECLAQHPEAIDGNRVRASLLSIPPCCVIAV